MGGTLFNSRNWYTFTFPLTKGIDFKDIKLYNILFIWSRYYILAALLEENFGNRNDRNRFGIM